MKARNRFESGSTLIIALLAIIVLAGASAAFLSISTYRNKEAVQSSDYTKTLYIAEAGVSRSIAEITADVDYDSDGMGDVSNSFDGGSYSVTAEDDGNDVWTITSTSTYNNLQRGIETVIGRRVSNPFSQGVFGGSSVSLSGSHAFVDSYDSDAGSYASQATNVDPTSGSTYANDNGGVASNGDINAGGGEVYGDLTPGPDGEVVGSGTYVTGSTTPADEPTDMPEYVYTPVGTSLGNLNSTCTLPAGTYRYDNMLLASTTVVTLGQNEGDVVTIYIDNLISITGQAQIIIPEGVSVIIHHGGSEFTSECLMPLIDIVGKFFAPAPKTLTVNTSGNGSVAKNPDINPYPHNTDVTLTATADAGWTFDHWEGDLSGNTNPAAITMNGDKTVTAVFLEGIRYTLATNVSGSGTVSKVPEQWTYAEGSWVTLSATADTSWLFNSWSGDLTGSTNPVSIEMTGNKSVTANFSPTFEEPEPEEEEQPDINLAGQGITNLNNNAGSLIIYSAALTINLAGQGDFTGVIYAPYADIDCSGQGHFCGAIVGNTIDLSGQTMLHYDEALASVSVEGNPGYIVKSWREFTP